MKACLSGAARGIGNARKRSAEQAFFQEGPQSAAEAPPVFSAGRFAVMAKACLCSRLEGFFLTAIPYCYKGKSHWKLTFLRGGR